MATVSGLVSLVLFAASLPEGAAFSAAEGGDFWRGKDLYAVIRPDFTFNRQCLDWDTYANTGRKEQCNGSSAEAMRCIQYTKLCAHWESELHKECWSLHLCKNQPSSRSWHICMERWKDGCHCRPQHRRYQHCRNVTEGYVRYSCEANRYMVKRQEYGEDSVVNDKVLIAVFKCLQSIWKNSDLMGACSVLCNKNTGVPQS